MGGIWSSMMIRTFTLPAPHHDCADSFILHSDFGHDKSLTLRPYAQLPEAERPVMFYAGDGVSDLSAARESDLLFAKEGMDLVTFCARENVPFTTFKDWSSINAKVQEIVAGKQSVAEAAKQGYEAYQASKSK